MKVLNSSKGIGGQLTGFRQLVGESKKITFIGSPGFCSPFAELMAYVLRGTEVKMAFVSNLDFDSAKSIVSTSDGMQFGEITDAHADTVIILGGLAMPKIGIDPKGMNEMIERVFEGAGRKLIIGVCFQSIFKEQKWTEQIDFDYIVDSDLSVDVIEM
ncbi:MAG TPA: DUF2124 domain-containing protein [Methanosarcinaceae archaeon]|nr:DUF2124 domain-containing protein [Methanosarcinaceae archaeon]